MLNWIVLNRTMIYIKMDLALNNIQRLICHKTQQTKPNHVGSIFLIIIIIIYIYIYIYIMVRVSANRPGDLGSIPGRVILKTQKMVLYASLFNTQIYKVRIKDEWSNLENEFALAPTRSSSYWKRSLCLANLYIYVYVWSVFSSKPFCLQRPRTSNSWSCLWILTNFP